MENLTLFMMGFTASSFAGFLISVVGVRKWGWNTFFTAAVIGWPVSLVLTLVLMMKYI